MKEETAGATAGCGLAIFMIVLGFFWLAAGWGGIEVVHGWGWGLFAVILALGFRFTLPLAYGVFLCATKVWGWHWFFALLIAAPGVALMIPAVLAGFLAAISKK